MEIAIYPGSFDPITLGHIEILKKACKMFDKVIIAVSMDNNKPDFLPIDTRIELIKKSVLDLKNVEVNCYSGLTVNYAQKNNAKFMIRGLRNSVDFEYEKSLAQINSSINNSVETVFFMSSAYNNISSSVVKEILRNGGDITNFVPKPVLNYFAK